MFSLPPVVCLAISSLMTMSSFSFFLHNVFAQVCNGQYNNSTTTQPNLNLNWNWVWHESDCENQPRAPNHTNSMVAFSSLRWTFTTYMLHLVLTEFSKIKPKKNRKQIKNNKELVNYNCYSKTTSKYLSFDRIIISRVSG